MVLLLPACTTTLGLRGEPLPADLVAYSEAGRFTVDVRAGSYEGAACVTPYEMFLPAGAGVKPLIVLAHGFKRSLETMRGWGELWASHGLATVIISQCNSSFLAGRHTENAQDMLGVVSKLGATQVIYAGFSAGGLSALLAANADHRAVGYLGLDPVDSGELAAGEIEQFSRPGLVLLGEASVCNAGSNIEPALASLTQTTVRRVEGSTHCHFENPYDRRCELACGRVKPQAAALERRQLITLAATVWLLAQQGDGRAQVSAESVMGLPGLLTVD